MNYLINETDETKQAVTDVVTACINVNEELDSELLQRIILKLLKMDCEVSVQDAFTITELIESVENEIIEFCNLDKLPNNVEPIEVNMVCGYFYKDKIGTNQKDSSTVKSIEEGDTTISFNTQKVDSGTVIFNLIDGSKKRLCKYRKLKW